MKAAGKPAQVHFAYQQIADEIEAQILRGDLNPGDQLPGEAELAGQFGVTRSTLREGLRQLESDGLVHRPSPRRLEVAVPQADQLTTRSGRAMALMKVTFRELWQVTMMTEPLAARLAAEHGTADEINGLQSLHAETVAAEGMMKRTISLDEDFHTRLADMGRNRVLGLAREPIALLLFRGFEQIAPFAPKFYKRQIEAHSNIIAALRDRDADRAEKWARMHIEDFWRGAQIAGLEDEIALNPRALS
ncbi:transcriptional regulator, GntR family [Pseudosulfitobacter pseudonitzschiae]|uniref:GntR family transcriptional regulator n=1 Tax=Pseudosulfitobacter pseudonitzschiae TaxID=1402135 RepID=A0A073IZL9_9RHOB|nr:FCD domain-containing protein [Pseudosulfitobacter pseudonitzschiae]KEJ95159.1 GntR family transcriptional regulator [Pseudosulfitobacter pseudonitzschiae]QKS11411.1 FadR family transcriptional regulator [Pseudosulfitobacter pseudonitzschiae]SHF89185.1 transcriptional regulator, GntR family [Pseudosulfitobacter pseudonitzschiae]